MLIGISAFTFMVGIMAYGLFFSYIVWRTIYYVNGTLDENRNRLRAILIVWIILFGVHIGGLVEWSNLSIAYFLTQCVKWGAVVLISTIVGTSVLNFFRNKLSEMSVEEGEYYDTEDWTGTLLTVAGVHAILITVYLVVYIISNALL